MSNNREILRGHIGNYVRLLNEDKGFQLKDIISEMLIYSSECVSGEIVNTSNYIDLSYDNEEEVNTDHDLESDKLYEIEDAKDIMSDLRMEMKKLSKSIKRGSVGKWEIENISEQAEDSLDEISEEASKVLSAEIKKIKSELSLLIKEAKASWAKSQLIETSSRIIHNISSIKSITSELDDVELVLREQSMISQEHLDLIRETKVRCASYRANKKSLDAEIAEKTGDHKKSTKLKSEAEALLSQDWRLIMKSDDVPSIDHLVK